MSGRFLTWPLVVLLITAVLPLGCGNERTEPKKDAIRILSLYRWVYRYTEDVGGDKINVTISFNFGDNKLYQYKQVGLLAGDEVDSYKILETGAYDATLEEIFFTPDEGDPYTLTWRQVEGSGDIEITLRDSRTLVFAYLPVESW